MMSPDSNEGESLYMCVCVSKGGKKNHDLTISFKHAVVTNRIQDIGIQLHRPILT